MYFLGSFFADLFMGMLVGKVEHNSFCEGFFECHGFEENIKIFYPTLVLFNNHSYPSE